MHTALADWKGRAGPARSATASPDAGLQLRGFAAADAGGTPSIPGRRCHLRPFVQRAWGSRPVCRAPRSYQAAQQSRPSLTTRRLPPAALQPLARVCRPPALHGGGGARRRTPEHGTAITPTAFLQQLAVMQGPNLRGQARQHERGRQAWAGRRRSVGAAARAGRPHSLSRTRSSDTLGHACMSEHRRATTEAQLLY